MTHPAHEHGAFARWGRYVSRHPWPWAIGAVAALLVITIPLIWIDFGQLGPGTDPTSYSDRRAYDLIAEGFGLHIPKGYIYFAMAFSVVVEMLNIRMRKRSLRPVHLHKTISEKKK